MNRPSVYLCGPINGRSFTDAEGWRTAAERLLAPEFGVLNPLRGKENKHTAANAATSSYTTQAAHENFTSREVVDRDLMDIRRCRAVIRYYDAPSEGSPMEAFYATHVCGIPVVVINATQRPDAELSLWLHHHAVRIVPTLDEAVAYLKKLWLYPGEEQPWSNAEARRAPADHLRDLLDRYWKTGGAPTTRFESMSQPDTCASPPDGVIPEGTHTYL